MTDSTAAIPADALGRTDCIEAAEAQQPNPVQHDPAQLSTAEEDAQQQADRLALLDLETEDDKAGKPLDTAVWGSTGHSVVDGALQMLQNCGLSTDDAVGLLYEAAAARDPGKVDRKALEAKIGPRRARAIMDGLAAFSKEMQPKDARIRGEVYQLTNGPHELQRLVAQAEDRLSASEMQDYLRALGKGGPSARRAVENLQAIVAGSPDRPHGRLDFTQARPDQHSAVEGITSAEYCAALTALHRSGRLSFEARNRREAELNEARRIGRRNGLR